MKYSEIAGLAEKELLKKTNELRKQMFEARMKNALGQLGNSGTIRDMRRDIARLQTALTAKLRAVVQGSETPKKATPSKKSSAAGRTKKTKAKG